MKSINLFDKLGKSAKIFFYIYLALVGILTSCYIYYGVDSYKLLSLSVLIVAYLILLTLAIIREKNLYFVIAILQIVVVIWFSNISAKDKFQGVTFKNSWLNKPKLTFTENSVTIDNIRDFKYTTKDDYQINYISQSFELDDLSSLDYALSYWDGNTKVAHSMLIFRFKDNRSLVFSTETRIPVGREQDLLSGIFKQFEEIIVIGTVEDIIDLRIKYRGNEKVYIYKTNTTGEKLRAFFLSMAHSAEDLNDNPQFYNTLTKNCTTSFIPNIQSVNPSFHNRLRLLLNGYSDQLFFELGNLANPDNLTFEQLKNSSLQNP